MATDSFYDRLLDRWMKDEYRVLNAHLPAHRKSLSVLLQEEYPFVSCTDGTNHLFKRKELAFLSGLLNEEEREKLLLPMLIELGTGQGEVTVICQTGLEEKVISSILKMPTVCREGRIILYRPQLSALRSILRTSTQYLFSPQILRE